MKYDRLGEMEKYILQKGSASMAELCERFGVSLITVRRDIAQLQLKGTINKIYGGVEARKADNLMPFDLRYAANSEAKDAIARRAVDFVRPGDTIFLDSGSTALRVVENLTNIEGLTIITHSLRAIISAMPLQNINVISLPGQLYRNTGSFTGLDAIRYLANYNISLAIMGASAFSLTGGVSNSSALESEIKATAMRRAAKKLLLTDSTKFGRNSMLTYAQLSDFDYIITEKTPAPEYVKACLDSGTQLIIAG